MSLTRFFTCFKPLSKSDPEMKLFELIAMVLVGTGALVGGVVGLLLPKISTGFSLGVFIALFFSMVSITAFNSIYLVNHTVFNLIITQISYGEKDFLGFIKEITVSSIVFIVCIASAVFLTQKFEVGFSDINIFPLYNI